MVFPHVYVVVLTWNGWTETEACLQSLLPVVTEGIRVLVVDNGSTDGTTEKIRQSYPSIEVLENGENLGFPAGNNVGIRYALSRKADYIILLNNDTIVDRGFARELIAVAEQDNKIGLVTSKIYFLDRPDVLWFAGGDLSTWTGRGTHAGYGEPDRGQFDEPLEIGRPCACSLLATRSFLEEVGLLREDLFLYGEEIDWMFRGRQKGYKNALAPLSKVWHKVSVGTGGPRSGTYLYYCVRNMLSLLNVHARIGFFPLNALRNLLVVLAFGASVFTMKVDTVKGLRNVLQGARDYLCGISGPRSV